MMIGNEFRPIVGAFVPSNFLSALSALPEANALALLDGAPAAVEVARRPEAFYRFLLHHLDREFCHVSDSNAQEAIRKAEEETPMNKMNQKK